MIEIKIDVCDIPEFLASFTKKEDDLSDKLDKAEAQCDHLSDKLDKAEAQRDLLEKQLERYVRDGEERRSMLRSQERERDDLKARLSRYEAIPGFQAPSEPMPMHMMTRSEAVENIGKMLIHLRDGEKILAIKIVRQLTGCGLKEAKDACDNYYLPR